MILYIKRIVCFFCTIILLFSSCNDGEREISEKYYYYKDAGYGKIVGRNVIRNRANVYPNVTNYRFNNNIIVAKQSPDRKRFTISLGRD